jgi:hypothetical protein
MLLLTVSQLIGLGAEHPVGITITKIYWLLGRKPKLSTSNELLIYKIIHKPIWIYGIQLWGTSCTPNTQILESFHSKALRMTVCAEYGYPKGSPNTKVKEENRPYSTQYSAHLSAHPNDLIVNLIELPDNRQLRRHLPNYLPARFLV